MKQHIQANPIPANVVTRSAGYDETVGVYERETYAFGAEPGSARSDGLPGYSRPVVVFFARRHADHGYRDELHLSREEAIWLARELLHRCRQPVAAAIGPDVAGALAEDLADELDKLRARLRDLAAGLRQSG